MAYFRGRFEDRQQLERYFFKIPDGYEVLLEWSNSTDYYGAFDSQDR